MGAIEAVLFDFGGTLFAHDSLFLTIHGAARRLGHPTSMVWADALATRIHASAHTDDELAHPRDLDAEVWAARWRVLYGAGDDDVPGLGAALYEAMHDPYEWRPYAGTAAVLSALSSVGVPVAVVSNTGWDIRSVFNAHALAPLVQHFVLSCDVGSVKPQPEIFHHACRQLGVAPAAALMVGDDSVADAGAVRAGLRTLLLPALPPGESNGVESVVRLVREN